MLTLLLLACEPEPEAQDRTPHRDNETCTPANVPNCPMEICCWETPGDGETRCEAKGRDESYLCESPSNCDGAIEGVRIAECG